MRLTAGFTSRSLRRPRSDLLVLGTALWVRLIYGAVAAFIITAAVVAGDFPADFYGSRLLGTLLIFGLAGIGLWKAMVERRLEIGIPVQDDAAGKPGSEESDSEESNSEEPGIRQNFTLLGVPLSSRRVGSTSDCRSLRLMMVPLGPGRRPDGSPRRGIYKLNLIGSGFDIYLEESSRYEGLLIKASEIGAALGVPVERVRD